MGTIYDGKVTGITKFGAFVALPGGKSGMVHISEIANTYVEDIKQFLTEGREVKVKLIAIDEMRHAEQFAERIKELGGEPNSELSSKITKGQKVMDVFPFNVKVEDDTIETYNKLLEICRTNGDSVSARLFERILDEEQVHDNYFCNMANHIETLGNTYLSKIAGSDSPEIPSRGFVDAE